MDATDLAWFTTSSLTLVPTAAYAGRTGAADTARIRAITSDMAVCLSFVFMFMAAPPYGYKANYIRPIFIYRILKKYMRTNAVLPFICSYTRHRRQSRSGYCCSYCYCSDHLSESIFIHGNSPLSGPYVSEYLLPDIKRQYMRKDTLFLMLYTLTCITVQITGLV